jgi:acetolactate synthase-1/2/3 large subunit
MVSITACGMLELLAQTDSKQPLDSLRDWWQSIESWRSRQCLECLSNW